MKKILFLLLTAMLLLVCSASASAEFGFPADLRIIGDEAFSGAIIGEDLLIPNGIETIGSKAFVGTGLRRVTFSNTLTYIAPDAFDKDVFFSVLPGSYAKNWCKTNGFSCGDITVTLDAGNVDVYYGTTETISANNALADSFTYRWEMSTDQQNWTVLENQTGPSLQIPYRTDIGRMFVHCRGSINNIDLDYSEDIKVDFFKEKVGFTIDGCKTLSADAVYLDWDYMGDDAVYTLYSCIDDDSPEHGHWEKIAEVKGDFNYTVYGLEKDTSYLFKVSATVETPGQGTVNIDAGEPICLKTEGDPTTIDVTECKTNGTALYIDWKALDRAVYDVTATDTEDEKTIELAANLTSPHLSYYVLQPDKTYAIQVIAKIPDSTKESGYVAIPGQQFLVQTGSGNPTIGPLKGVRVGETAQLSWTGLQDVTYNIYQIDSDGKKEFFNSTTFAYYDVGGLPRNEASAFCVQAVSGEWKSSFTDSVTIPPKEREQVEYRALLVGEESHKGTQRLEHAYRDVELLADVLQSTNTPTYGRYSVLRRKDILKTELLNTITEAFQFANENDVSLFMISTHGNVTNNDEYAGALSLVDSAGNEEIITLRELAAALSNVKGKVIVWLSSCGSGAAVYEDGVPQNGDSDFNPAPVNPAALNAAAVEAFSAYDSVVNLNTAPSGDFAVSDTAAFETGEFRQSGKFYVLTAARYHQVSWGAAGGVRSEFIGFICDGLGIENDYMRADANRDGKLTQHELFMYIKAREEDPEHRVNQDVQTYPLNSDYDLFVN